MRFDLPVPEPEELSRDELIVVVRRQAVQISAQAVQISELVQPTRRSRAGCPG